MKIVIIIHSYFLYVYFSIFIDNQYQQYFYIFITSNIRLVGNLVSRDISDLKSCILAFSSSAFFTNAGEQSIAAEYCLATDLFPRTSSLAKFNIYTYIKLAVFPLWFQEYVMTYNFLNLNVFYIPLMYVICFRNKFFFRNSYL